MDDTALRDILTIKDICAYLGVSDDYIRAQIKSGKLRAMRLGVKIHIRRADLEAFLDAAYIN